jgi:hypothetical protein
MSASEDEADDRYSGLALSVFSGGLMWGNLQKVLQVAHAGV